MRFLLPLALAFLMVLPMVTWSADTPSTTPATQPSGELPKLPTVPKAAVDAAIAAPLIRFNRTIKGGAHTDGGPGGGNSITLALAAMQGDTSADARLLEQLRYNLKPDTCISANGGYPAQHERHVTGMYALVKLTPRVWNQLKPDEQAKIDLLSKAALIASAYTTSDVGYADGKKTTAVDGDDNLNRGWNPNYREGMIGGLIVGVVYFGGPVEAHKILDTYDHEAFIAQLKEAGLTNTYDTFNWKTAHPDSKAPDGATLTATIKNFRYLGKDLSDPMDIYYGLTMRTYGAKVSPGLNDGKGLKDAGMIVSGADKLPNLGKDGMLGEFDSHDAGGPRSAMGYSFDGFRCNLTNHIVLLAGGYWKKGKEADEILTKMNIGITDLYYKLDHGYKDYSKGKGSTHVFDINQKGANLEGPRILWESVVKPYHEGTGETAK